MLRQGTMVLSRLLILPFLLAILIGLDVYKTYEVPDRTISLNGGDVKGLNRSGLPKSPIFFFYPAEFHYFLILQLFLHLFKNGHGPTVIKTEDVYN